ncbi:MAG: cation transporter [Candidatus Zixiibacteriota bacterium]|nr:MAG: cation transporter [candidate division Zixibacteria bacterium]
MKIPKLIIPLLVIAALIGGYSLRAAFTQPTTNVTLGSSQGKQLECIVSGVKCKGTARYFTSLYEGVDGIGGIETFAADHRAIFTYDPSVITPEDIRRIMEAPIPLGEGDTAQVFECLSMKEQ